MRFLEAPRAPHEHRLRSGLIGAASAYAIALTAAALACAPAFDSPVLLVADFAAPNAWAGHARFTGRTRIEGRESLIGRIFEGDRPAIARRALQGALAQAIAQAGPSELLGDPRALAAWRARMEASLARSLAAGFGGSWSACVDPGSSLSQERPLGPEAPGAPGP